jgi:hypothetical protein
VLIETGLTRPNGDREVLPPPVVIQGVPTDGQADSMRWTLNHWFKITGTTKIEGTTYLVANPIVEDKRHTEYDKQLSQK